MILSILIPSIPSRREMASKLYDKIAAQAAEFPDVEVLMLIDNKKRSIGLKRQALVDVAAGDYMCFADDDDDVMDGYLRSIHNALYYAPDVLTFDSLCTIENGPDVLVGHDFYFDNEQYNPAGFKRKPWHIHPWRKELARAAKFPDLSYGEDWPWCKQMLDRVRSHMHLTVGPLYHYRFNSAITEAK